MAAVHDWSDRPGRGKGPYPPLAHAIAARAEAEPLRAQIERCMALVEDPHHRRALGRRLRARSNQTVEGAWFELLLGGVLTRIVAQVEWAPELADGSTPDFRIDAGGGPLLVELTGVGRGESQDRARGHVARVEAMLEGLKSRHGVMLGPRLTADGSVSLQPLRDHLMHRFHQVEQGPDEGTDGVRAALHADHWELFESPGVRVRFRIVPHLRPKPGSSFFSSFGRLRPTAPDKERLRDRVLNKARRYRQPMVVAIALQDLLGLGDLVEALARPTDAAGPLREVLVRDHPHVAGVLALQRRWSNRSDSPEVATWLLRFDSPSDARLGGLTSLLRTGYVANEAFEARWQTSAPTTVSL